ncbi:MAG: KH domain-containing protein [Candidatus Hodarchaeales archaeon]|jgi:ribosomal RNA assembly protein
MVIESRLMIPRSRIGVMIGIKGKTKLEIESITNVAIEVNSEDGSVHIQSVDENADPTFVWKARDIVKAIGRGFNSEKAFFLLDDDVFLETIELGGSKNNIKRLKSRIIGEKGKAKKMIEKNTEAMISIFGNQVSVIGELSEIRHAKEAINQLIQGSKHGTVFRYLEQLRFKSKLKPPKIWKEKELEES